MKKGFVILSVLMLATVIFAGCTAAPASNGGAGTAQTSGETFDAGNVNALVPEGWMAFTASDLLDEYEGDTNTNSFSIYKGAQYEFDQLTKPGLQITYYDKDTTMMEPWKDLYEDTEDISPFTLGAYTWEGFTGKSSDYPIAVLWTEDGDEQFQVNIWLENGGQKLTLEDADVQAILTSISPTK